MSEAGEWDVRNRWEQNLNMRPSKIWSVDFTFIRYGTEEWEVNCYCLAIKICNDHRKLFRSIYRVRELLRKYWTSAHDQNTLKTRLNIHKCCMYMKHVINMNTIKRFIDSGVSRKRIENSMQAQLKICCQYMHMDWSIHAYLLTLNNFSHNLNVAYVISRHRCNILDSIWYALG